MQSHPATNEHQNKFTFIIENRYQVEQNAIFIDYSLQSLLDNILIFKDLNIYHRTALAKNIPSLKEQLLNNPQAFANFLSHLAHDCEANQAELVEYLRKQVERGCVKKEEEQGLVAALQVVIQFAHLEMKQIGCGLLVSLLHKHQKEQRQPITQFAHKLLAREEEDLKIAGIQLTAKMTTFLSKDQAEHCFKDVLKPLYDTTTLRVKKEIISNCSIIATNVSERFLSHDIIKHFIAQHCKQPMMSVRKSCVQVIPLLIPLTTTEKVTLATLLMNFTKDGHKVIRLTACKAVPEFLGKYQGAQLPEQMLQFYLNLPDHQINKIVNRENQILHPVAFYFTAVLQQLGVAGWPRMSLLFNKLLFFKHDEVTLPIASSLHQIAVIIGPQLSRQYLFPAFNNIFKQNSDELKLVALSHFSQFVAIFSSGMRQNLIDVFMVLQKNPRKWRIRYEIARQLSIIAQNYEAETLFRFILPISLKLANDPVSLIREETARHMHEVIAGMSKDPAYENIAEESLKGFGLSMQYQQRETFARMVGTLHLLHDFREKYYSIVVDLASDPIAVVRMALAISVKQILRDYPKKKEGLTAVIAALRKDQEVSDILD